jgi:hypothetical protein
MYFFLSGQLSLHPGHTAGTTPREGSNHSIGRARCLSRALAHEWRLPALSAYVQQHTGYAAPLGRCGNFTVVAGGNPAGAAARWS